MSKFVFNVSRSLNQAEYNSPYRIATIHSLPCTVAYRFHDDGGPVVLNKDLIQAKGELTKMMIEAILHAEWIIDE